MPTQDVQGAKNSSGIDFPLANASSGSGSGNEGPSGGPDASKHASSHSQDFFLEPVGQIPPQVPNSLSISGLDADVSSNGINFSRSLGVFDSQPGQGGSLGPHESQPSNGTINVSLSGLQESQGTGGLQKPSQLPFPSESQIINVPSNSSSSSNNLNLTQDLAAGTGLEPKRKRRSKAERDAAQPNPERPSLEGVRGGASASSNVISVNTSSSSDGRRQADVPGPQAAAPAPRQLSPPLQPETAPVAASSSVAAGAFVPLTGLSSSVASAFSMFMAPKAVAPAVSPASLAPRNGAAAPVPLPPPVAVGDAAASSSGGLMHPPSVLGSQPVASQSASFRFGQATQPSQAVSEFYDFDPCAIGGTGDTIVEVETSEDEDDEAGDDEPPAKRQKVENQFDPPPAAVEQPLAVPPPETGGAARNAQESPQHRNISVLEEPAKDPPQQAPRAANEVSFAGGSAILEMSDLNASAFGSRSAFGPAIVGGPLFAPSSKRVPGVPFAPNTSRDTPHFGNSSNDSLLAMQRADAPAGAAAAPEYSASSASADVGQTQGLAPVPQPVAGASPATSQDEHESLESNVKRVSQDDDVRRRGRRRRRRGRGGGRGASQGSAASAGFSHLSATQTQQSDRSQSKGDMDVDDQDQDMDDDADGGGNGMSGGDDDASDGALDDDDEDLLESASVTGSVASGQTQKSNSTAQGRRRKGRRQKRRARGNGAALPVNFEVAPARKSLCSMKIDRARGHDFSFDRLTRLQIPAAGQNQQAPPNLGGQHSHVRAPQEYSAGEAVFSATGSTACRFLHLGAAAKDAAAGAAGGGGGGPPSPRSPRGLTVEYGANQDAVAYTAPGHSLKELRWGSEEDFEVERDWSPRFQKKGKTSGVASGAASASSAGAPGGASSSSSSSGNPALFSSHYAPGKNLAQIDAERRRQERAGQHNDERMLALESRKIRIQVRNAKRADEDPFGARTVLRDPRDGTARGPSLRARLVDRLEAEKLRFRGVCRDLGRGNRLITSGIVVWKKTQMRSRQTAPDTLFRIDAGGHAVAGGGTPIIWNAIAWGDAQADRDIRIGRFVRVFGRWTQSGVKHESDQERVAAEARKAESEAPEERFGNTAPEKGSIGPQPPMAVSAKTAECDSRRRTTRSKWKQPQRPGFDKLGIFDFHIMANRVEVDDAYDAAALAAMYAWDRAEMVRSRTLRSNKREDHVDDSDPYLDSDDAGELTDVSSAPGTPRKRAQAAAEEKSSVRDWPKSPPEPGIVLAPPAVPIGQLFCQPIERIRPGNQFAPAARAGAAAASNQFTALRSFNSGSFQTLTSINSGSFQSFSSRPLAPLPHPVPPPAPPPPQVQRCWCAKRVTVADLHSVAAPTAALQHALATLPVDTPLEQGERVCFTASVSRDIGAGHARVGMPQPLRKKLKTLIDRSGGLLLTGPTASDVNPFAFGLLKPSLEHRGNWLEMAAPGDDGSKHTRVFVDVRALTSQFCALHPRPRETDLVCVVGHVFGLETHGSDRREDCVLVVATQMSARLVRLGAAQGCSLDTLRQYPLALNGKG